jgi:hypothetical protein
MLHDHAAISSSTIRADELTEGDVIQHLLTGDIWQVASEPEYTIKGIGFEVTWLSDSQDPCFIYAQPHQHFELLDHNPSQAPVIEVGKPADPYFVHSLIHQGQLIAILAHGANFTFRIFSAGSLLEESLDYYADLGAALNAALARVEQDARWQAGFESYDRGEPFPEIADPDFICGWRDAQEADKAA